MRGKAYDPKQANNICRITPAYAGKRAVPDDEKQDHKDHPRLCGEKDHCLRHWLLSPGSPPPMRGKALSVSVSALAAGITPAYAGKSCSNTTTASRSWDHPRLCGEKEPTENLPIRSPGSPPPMRGKDFVHDVFLHVFRITPAYAGKRAYDDVGGAFRGDHPRLCGEKGSALMQSKATARITPAYAGKSHKNSRFLWSI